MKPKGKHAWIVTVGTKGQIVIPKEAREIFGIQPGDTLILLGDEKRGIAIPPKPMITDAFTHILEKENVFGDSSPEEDEE